MKKYISLAGALLLGSVVASTKKAAVNYKSVAVARKATVAQVQHAHHAAKATYKKKVVETSVTSLADELTSNNTFTSVNDVRAATSVTTKDGDVTSKNTVTSESTTEAAYRGESVTTLDGELSSHKTITSVDDVKSWWDKKNTRVASWWDTKNQRVASWWDAKNQRVASWWDAKNQRVASWWDTKNQRVASWWDAKNQRVASAWWDTKNVRVSSHWWDNTRVASPWWDTKVQKKVQKKTRVASPWWDTKKAVKGIKVKQHIIGTCGQNFGLAPGTPFWCYDASAGYNTGCGQLTSSSYNCCMSFQGCPNGQHIKTWHLDNHNEDDD